MHSFYANDTEFNRVKALLPRNLQDKAVPQSFYDMKTQLIAIYAFYVEPGLDRMLCDSGLRVILINQIICEYLYTDQILEIINAISLVNVLPGAINVYKEILNDVLKFELNISGDEKKGSVPDQPSIVSRSISSNSMSI